MRSRPANLWGVTREHQPETAPRAAAAALMSTIYDEHKDEDGFLYIVYSGENTFGASLLEEPLLDLTI